MRRRERSDPMSSESKFESFGCDVHHDCFQARCLGDCDFGMIHFRQDLPRKKIDAIARLIGNAPAMFEALREVLRQFAPSRDHMTAEQSATFDKARAVLAAVEGTK
jgi:hypothetical protein